VKTRRQIDVSGMVQGVGFRPYVYHLASLQSLAGNVRNTSEGVTIQLEGPAQAIDEFLERLPREVPPLARITAMQVHDLPCNDDQSFHILESSEARPAHTLISPDIAVCADCLRELFDPANRRYLYPFINCTNCGPRFTILQRIPYDRPHTSMSRFQMCADCASEYGDPRDRRFHAQPNACWCCGPRLQLLDADSNEISIEEPLAEAISRLSRGKIVAIKGLGGFHLAVDATNPGAVRRLRDRKHRLEKPLAVMCPDADAAEEFCVVDQASRIVLESPSRPIVLLPMREASALADEVAHGLGEFGIFLPYTPLHHLLFRSAGIHALVMTSANHSEEPIVIANEEGVERLRGLADCHLVHDRDIVWRCDDSVVSTRSGVVRQIRRSRGFVPAPIELTLDAPPVLAVGGELKNVVCLAKGREAFLSQHIGDLENLESFEFFRDVTSHLTRIFEIQPRAIAHDLHPEYLSTKWALEQTGLPRIGVQHHHSHIAACMAENLLQSTVLGIALDGAGYGSDGAIWGGEILVADYSQFRRAAHFEYIPMPGAAQAVREPWRMALAYLHHHFGRDLHNLEIPFVRDLPARQVQPILQMLAGGVNSPLTSSCGRLFDAVAALIGVRSHVSYEGQAAIELEVAASRARNETGGYPLAIEQSGEEWIVRTFPLFDALVKDIQSHISVEVMSARFHLGLVNVLERLAVQLRHETALNRVCLSGGTFQNDFLFERLATALNWAGFEVFSHSKVPCGDGGLSLGQAIVAAHRVM
jgi:hydrogenase maturation protein HypF